MTLTSFTFGSRAVECSSATGLALVTPGRAAMVSAAAAGTAVDAVKGPAAPLATTHASAPIRSRMRWSALRRPVTDPDMSRLMAKISPVARSPITKRRRRHCRSRTLTRHMARLLSEAGNHLFAEHANGAHAVFVRHLADLHDAEELVDACVLVLLDDGGAGVGVAGADHGTVHEVLDELLLDRLLVEVARVLGPLAVVAVALVRGDLAEVLEQLGEVPDGVLAAAMVRCGVVVATVQHREAGHLVVDHLAGGLRVLGCFAIAADELRQLPRPTTGEAQHAEAVLASGLERRRRRARHPHGRMWLLQRFGHDDTRRHGEVLAFVALVLVLRPHLRDLVHGLVPHGLRV